MSPDDAMNYLVDSMQKMPSVAEGYTEGLDIDIPQIIRIYLRDVHRLDDTQRVYELSTVFLNAAWHLCCQGVLRPGASRIGLGLNSYDDVISNYTLTPYGIDWLRQHGTSLIVPDPTRFSQMCRPYADKFGDAYFERAQEASRCHQAHAYLACCVMCGAAAESVVLALYMAKKQQAYDEVMRVYQASNGRSRVQNEITNGTNGHIQREFPRFLELLKYWRDMGAHGGPASITETEAYTSLLMLLRFSQFGTDNWADLTDP